MVNAFIFLSKPKICLIIDSKSLSSPSKNWSFDRIYGNLYAECSSGTSSSFPASFRVRIYGITLIALSEYVSEVPLTVLTLIPFPAHPFPRNGA